MPPIAFPASPVRFGEAFKVHYVSIKQDGEQDPFGFDLGASRKELVNLVKSKTSKVYSAFCPETSTLENYILFNGKEDTFTQAQTLEQQLHRLSTPANGYYYEDPQGVSITMRYLFSLMGIIKPDTPTLVVKQGEKGKIENTDEILAQVVKSNPE